MKRWIVLFFLGTMIYVCLSAGQGLWINQAEANIIFKSTVVNPSTTKTQTAVLKGYLPKETKPEDIIDLGDMKIDYDVAKGLYYVHKECELAPGESVMRSIELKDVWVISAAEIDALTGQAKEIVEKLKKTVYFDTAVSLQKDIEVRSGEILTKQDGAANALPQTHIAVYRENVETLDSIKNDLAQLDDMLLRTKLSKAEEGSLREKVSVKATWWIILVVIISLGLLSIVFFIIWHRQATGIGEIKDKKMEEEEIPPPESGKE